MALLKCLSGAFAVALVVMLPAVVQAQPASQIVPPSFRPEVVRPGGIALPGAPGLGTPPGAEKLTVRLSGVRVQGGLPQLAAASVELEQRLAGRQVSGVEIFAAARDLEAAYGRAGYVLARVLLPPQHLVNGSRLTLIVVDGFVERVELKDVPDRLRPLISKLLAPLVGKRGLTLTELERRVLLAGDLPGAILRTTLAPGSSDGGTILVVEAKYQPVSATLSYDNTLAQSLGGYTAGVGLDLNGIAGFGELVYLRANGNPEGGANGLFERYPTNRALAGGFVVPLWIDGLSFNAEVTDARTTPRAVLGIQTTDTFQRLSLRMRYAWLRGRAGNFNTEVTFDAQDEVQSLFVASALVPLSEDRLRILRLSHDGDVLTPWGATIFGRIAGSFGIDGLGARPAADTTPFLPLSRQGADATFQKLDVTLGYAQDLIPHLSIHLIARAQTSFGQALARSEQIGIANPVGLSVLDAGSLAGDRGFVTRGELRSPWVLPLPADRTDLVVTPYAFGAYGSIAQERPTALEAASVTASAFGGGLRLTGQVPGQLSNALLAFEYGRATRSDGLPAGDRFTILTMLRF